MAGKWLLMPRLMMAQTRRGTATPWATHFQKRSCHAGSSLPSRFQCSRTAMQTAPRRIMARNIWLYGEDSIGGSMEKGETAMEIVFGILRNSGSEGGWLVKRPK